MARLRILQFYYDFLVKYVSREAIDLLKKMLTYDPERRIAAEEALKHPWITKKAHEEVDNEEWMTWIKMSLNEE